MLPARRQFHSTQHTAGILSNFPAWMKLRQPDSVGFKFTDAILGNELELLNSTLGVYQNYNSIVKSPIDAMTEVYQVELPYYLKTTMIQASDKDNLIDISIVENNQEFLTNPPTRINSDPTMFNIGLSGLNGNIVGIEWLDGFPSGQLVIKTDASEIVPSSLLYYNIDSITDSINPIPFSGIALGIGYVGLGYNGLYESGVIQSNWNLLSQYPSDTYLYQGAIYTGMMPSGLSSSYQSYYDSDTGKKTYVQLALNNPYGSGVYDQFDIQLSQIPINGTIVLSDVFNLTSGVPTVIPSSGLNIYGYTSGYYQYSSDPSITDLQWQQDPWSYKGLQNPIDWNILPADFQKSIIANWGESGVGPTANVIGNISWRLLPSGGYVDDEVYPHKGTFKWIDGSGGLSNVIRISGGFSKYTIEYAYPQFNKVTQISAEPKVQYTPASQISGQIYFITESDLFQPIPFEVSRSSPTALRIDPNIIRPGVPIYYTANMNTSYKTTWENANMVDKTFQFFNHNIGYTDNLGIR